MILEMMTKIVPAIIIQLIMLAFCVLVLVYSTFGYAAATVFTAFLLFLLNFSLLEFE